MTDDDKSKLERIRKAIQRLVQQKRIPPTQVAPESKETKPGIVTPAIVLTPEQIMERVERERRDPKHQAEIERYRQEYDS